MFVCDMAVTIRQGEKGKNNQKRISISISGASLLFGRDLVSDLACLRLESLGSLFQLWRSGLLLISLPCSAGSPLLCFFGDLVSFLSVFRRGLLEKVRCEPALRGLCSSPQQIVRPP